MAEQLRGGRLQVYCKWGKCFSKLEAANWEITGPVRVIVSKFIRVQIGSSVACVRGLEEAEWWPTLSVFDPVSRNAALPALQQTRWKLPSDSNSLPAAAQQEPAVTNSRFFQSLQRVMLPSTTSSRGLLAGLLDRELSGNRRFAVPSSYIHAFSCSGQQAGVIKVDPDGDPCPPYSITYNQAVQGCRLLTVGDEEGCVSIVDTSAATLPDSLYTDAANPPRARWLAHNNTIFDLAWAKNDSVLYTASGDQHVGVWDTAAGRLRVYCAGHDGSVKVVTPHTTSQDILASGSRDGGILLWDLRLPSTWSATRRRMQLQPVGRISITTPAAHHHSSSTTPTAAAGPAGATPGSKGVRGRGGGSARRSVTSLQFLPQDGHTLVSSSDMDGTVKLWDLRSLTAPTADITLPPAAAAAAAAAAGGGGGGGRGRGGRGGVVGAAGGGGAAVLSFSCPGRSNRPAGVTSMALSPCGSLLLVSSIDSCHYLYRLSQLDGPPVATFAGHRSGSFCVKAGFSPCGDYLVSGSSDGKAYVWQVSDPSLPPSTLCGHTGEVTAVAWCPQDYCQLATAADDASVRVWAMDRSGSAYQRAFDHHNYSFADTHADALWGRFGIDAAAGAGASLEANLQGLNLQRQQQQQQREEKGEEVMIGSAACVREGVALIGPSRGAAGGEGSGEGTAAAAAAATGWGGGGVGVGAEGGVTPLRGDGGVPQHPQRSICSPSTPQLPFWRMKAAEAGGGGGAPAAAAAAAGGGGAGGGYQQQQQQQQPLVIQPEGGGQTGVSEAAAAVDSSQPDIIMDVEAGPAAAAATTEVLPAAGGGCGGAADAASFFTPIRTRRKGGPGGSTPMPPPAAQQHLNTPAGPTGAAAAAADPAAAGPPSAPAVGAAGVAAVCAAGATAGKGGARKSAVRKDGARAAGRAAGRGKGAAAAASGRTPDGLRQLTLTEQLAAAAAARAKQQQQQQHTPEGQAAGAHAGRAAVAAAAAAAGGGGVSEKAQTTPPTISRAAGAANDTPAAAAAAAAAAGVVFGPQLKANSAAARLCGAAVLGGQQVQAAVHPDTTSTTPWSLLRQMQQAHLGPHHTPAAAATAAGQQLLMPERFQPLLGGSPQRGEGAGGASFSGGDGLGGGRVGGRYGGGAGGGSSSGAVRLLADEFEVFCDENDDAAAAAAAAGEAGQQEGQLGVEAAGLGSSGGGRRAARRVLGIDVSQPAAAAASAAAGGSEGLLSPSGCSSLLSPSGHISCQENMWLAAAAAGGGTAAAAGAGLCDSPMDVDMVPCSLPPEQLQDPCSTQQDSQQQQQQQQQQQHGIQEDHPHQQQQQVGGDGGSNGGGRRLLHCNSLPLPPKVAEVLGVSRTPLGDLSPLLLPHETAAHHHHPASPSPAGGVACVLLQQQQGCGDGNGGGGGGGGGLRVGSLSPRSLLGVGRLTRTRLGMGERSSPVRVLQMSSAAGGGGGGGCAVLQMLGGGGQQQQQCGGGGGAGGGGGVQRGAAGMLLSGSCQPHQQQGGQQCYPQQQQQQGGSYSHHLLMSPPQQQRQQGGRVRPCSPLKPKTSSPDGPYCSPGGHTAAVAAGVGVAGDGAAQHSSGDGVPRKRSRLGECTPDKVRPAGGLWSGGGGGGMHTAGLSFSQRLAAAAAAQQQQQLAPQMPLPEALLQPQPQQQQQLCEGDNDLLLSIDRPSRQLAGTDSQADAQQQQQQRQAQQLMQREGHMEEGHGEAMGEEEGAAGKGAAAAAAPGGPGGMRRSAVAPASSRKRQCRLADLWNAKQPEVEDGASRFSGY